MHIKNIIPTYLHTYLHTYLPTYIHTILLQYKGHPPIPTQNWVHLKNLEHHRSAITLRYHWVITWQWYWNAAPAEIREKNKKGKKREGKKCPRQNEKITHLRQWVDRDRWGRAFPGLGQYGSLDWFLSHLVYRRIWMSKGATVICYSNVMRLWRHTNILLQLKQKYWESQERRGSQFQSGRQFKFPRNCLTHAALTNCLTLCTDKCVKMKKTTLG